MQLNKLVGAIRAKMDWHAVEDVMVGDSQITRVRYWCNSDPERGGIGFVAEPHAAGAPAAASKTP